MLPRYGTRKLDDGQIFYGSATPDASAYFMTANCSTFPILSCQYISDTWGVDYGVTDGSAPEVYE